MPELPALSPISNEPLSVVLLARRTGEQDLLPLLEMWRNWLESQKRVYELLVVVAQPCSLPEQSWYRRIVSEPGEGTQLRVGLSQAQYPLIFYTRAEPDYRPEDLGRLLEQKMTPAGKSQPEPVIDHVHWLSACRVGMPLPLWLRVVRWLWYPVSVAFFAHRPQPVPGWVGWSRFLSSVAAWFFFGVRLHDPSCPFRLLRRDILTHIPLQSTSAFVHIELLAKANFLSCLMSEELPLNVRPGAASDEMRAIWKDAWLVLRKPTFGSGRPASPPV
jgi:hypothetical protein